jgi:hypothetical protein
MKIIFGLLAVMILGVSSAAFCAPVRTGIQRNLPVYVKTDILTAAEADSIRQGIATGELKESFVLAGTWGTNYWVDLAGVLHSKRYCMEAVAKNEDTLSGRFDREICGWKFLQGCDNLFIPDVQKTVAPPPPFVKELSLTVEQPICPPPQSLSFNVSALRPDVMPSWQLGAKTEVDLNYLQLSQKGQCRDNTCGAYPGNGNPPEPPVPTD